MAAIMINDAELAVAKAKELGTVAEDLNVICNIITTKAAEMAAMDGILGLGERFQRNCDDIINIIKELQAPSEDIAKYVGAMANTMLELQQGTGEKI